MNATRLTCEFRIDPLGIDNLRPRLGWIVQASGRNRRQTAFRILVAKTRDGILAGKGDLWDSGKEQSDHTTMIRYEGSELKSGEMCFWKVMLWDEHDVPGGWSPPASWSMGILNRDEWKAQWIGYDAPRQLTRIDTTWRFGKAEGILLPPPRYLKTTFAAKRSVKTAVVYVSALGICDVYLDNVRISEDRFTPGWTDYTRRVYYRTYDVTPMIRPGAHAIGAILADGWYSGYVGYGGQRDHYGARTRLLLQMVVTYDDGTTDTIATGPAWKAATGPIREADFLMGEFFDAREAADGLISPGDGGSPWVPVDVGSEVHPLIEAHPGPPVDRFAEISPVSVSEPSPGKWVFDLGRNFAGVARLKVVGTSGQRITMRYAERLNPDGTIYVANLRSARATDTYICRGPGTEVWEPRFTFHGFQYVEVSGLKSQPPLDMVTGIAISSVSDLAGRFECSDTMVNTLYQNIVWTQRANFIDIPTDCPQRDERLGWTGDAQIFIRSGCLLGDVHAFYRKWLIDLMDAQRADGEFPMVAPLKVAGNDGGPGWADAGVICPWTVYDVYGDRDVLAKCYPAMARFVEFCRTRSTPELLPPQEFHCFGDWLNVDAETPTDVIFEAYFARSTYLLGEAARALAKAGDAQHYDSLFNEIKRSFNSAYVETDGRIKGNTQTAYVLALAFGLLDEQGTKLAAQHLVNDIESRGWHLSTGFLGTKNLMLVLHAIGRVDVAYRLLENDTYPSWGFTIRNGATSIWERWDGWTPEKGFQTPDMNSFSHYSFGAVYQWMVESIGGIKNESPGFRTVVIAPQPGGNLAWARVGYRSEVGEILVEWRRTGDRRILTIGIPANVTAKVVLPGAVGAVLESGKPAERQPGVIVSGPGKFRVGSGTYRFSYGVAP